MTTPGPTSRSRLVDVARLAGVSTATASRALNTPDIVAEDTRNAVAEAAKACGYKPNLLARSLRTRKTGVILAVLPELDNHFYPDIVRGIEDGARERGYSIMLGFTRMTESREIEYFELLENRRVDGLIVVDDGLQIQMQKGRRPAVPYVELMESYGQRGAPSVRIEDRAAAWTATRHLIDLGHRRIGHIAGQPGSAAAALRLAGYLQALSEASLPHDPALIEDGEYNIESGTAATGRLLGRSEPPTAIFCVNDAAAFGVLRYCLAEGIRVPEQLSVIGINGVKESASSTPPLTTIGQPRHQIGSSGVHLLADLIAHRPNVVTNVLLPFEIILRQSTAPPGGFTRNIAPPTG